jgi:predicted glycoside hydrolase/deacetylase ChbG (UPF0249 family)
MVVYGVATRTASNVYVLIWEPEHVDEVLRAIENWLLDEELDFEWLEAAELEASVRDIACVE